VKDILAQMVIARELLIILVLAFLKFVMKPLNQPQLMRLVLNIKRDV